MELKTLILGLAVSLGAFAVKSGGGLSYLYLQMPGKWAKTLVSLYFIACYGVVFMAAAWVLSRVDLTRHINILQGFFKSGMALHLLLALLISVWGVRLLVKNRQDRGITRGWVPLVVPCPICFCVILLSSSFVSALYPGTPLVFVCLYIGFVLISLTVALLFAFVIRDRERAGSFLGTLMLYIAGYFILSVIVIPQFGDLDRIYRISLAEDISGISKDRLIVIVFCLVAVFTGFVSTVFKQNERE